MTEDSIKLYEEYIISLRRKFHRMPELGFDLDKTAEAVKNELDSMNIEYREFSRNALIARVECSDRSAGTIAFRADMDALPVQEQWECEYKSENEGRMHACGHDGHMAMMLGFLKMISDNPLELKNNIIVFFQPAEETMEGSRVFLNEPEIREADMIFAIHLWSQIEEGKACAKAGPRMASADKFKIKIKGLSAHGGEPQYGIDAIVCASNTVMALQTIVSRNTDPNESCVITAGRIKGGQAYNIVADYAEIEGTFRCYSRSLRENLKAQISEMAENISKSYRCTAETEYFEGPPAVVNELSTSLIAEEAVRKVMGEDSAIDFRKLGGGEDFAFMMEKIPGTLILLGTADEQSYPHHHPMFHLNEKSLIKGARIFYEIAVKRR